MTVIVWDGETLVADRRACKGDLRRTVTKIVAHGDELLAACGDTALGLLLMAWYCDGAKPQEFPRLEDDDDAELVVVKADGVVWLFERKPVPIIFHDRMIAFGAGAKYALGAMEMGADSIQAALVACKLSVSCGDGIDAYRLGSGRVQAN